MNIIKNQFKKINFLQRFLDSLDNLNERPKCIISDTNKANGLSFAQGIAKWHFRSPTKVELELGLKELSE